MNVLRKAVSSPNSTTNAVVRWQRRALSGTNRHLAAIGARSIGSSLVDSRPNFAAASQHYQCTTRHWFSTDDATAPKPDRAAIITDSNSRIQAYALQGDAPAAQAVLDELEGLVLATASTQEEAQDALLEAREAVLDAWISHQNTLFQEWQSSPSETPAVELRASILEAAQHAHRALEQTVPFLAQPAVAIYMQHHQQQKRRGKGKKKEDYDEAAILEDPQGVLGKRQSTNPRVQSHRCNAVLTAWARASQVSSGRQGIPQRSQYLIQRMEASLEGPAAPSVESYNALLEAWAWSPEHLRATMAEQIFRIMLGGKKHAKPNGESYKWIIQAWCLSKQKKAAFNATGHLMKWLRRVEKGREEIEPDVETYRMVMKAWTVAEDRNAPMKALGILRIMEYAYDNSHCTVAPDEACYKHYLVASARKSLVPEQGPLAEQILAKLKSQSIVPDQDCYTAAIRIWKNSALNRLFGEKREHAITRAVEMLQELSMAHHRSTLVSIRPTTENYNDALEALAQSRKSVSKTVAESLVKVMEESFAENEESEIRPNAETYQWLLLVYAKSRSADKLQSANEALQRLKDATAKSKSMDSTNQSQIVDVYNAFLRVCESMPPEEGQEILQDSLGAVEAMRSSYDLKPNSQTYAKLLDVCKRHLEVGTERSRIVKSIFDACCEEGLVNEPVLQSLKAATSDEQYFQLVLAVSEEVEGNRMVPEDWSRNVGVQRKVTASGRKAAPLSVDGRFTVTKAMKEYRMRKLRSKNNQRVLQGGRVKLDPKKRGEAIRIELDEEALAKLN